MDTLLIDNYLENENGAVTVDMVPLMAVVVAMGLAVVAIVETGVTDASAQFTEVMGRDSIISTSFEGARPLGAAGSVGNGNRNNGFGNGDQDAPGNSEFNNNAENAGGN